MASETFDYFISRTWRKWRTLPPSIKGYYQYYIIAFQTPDTRQAVVSGEVEYADEKGQLQSQEFSETTTFTALTFDFRPKIRFKSAAFTQNLTVQVHWVPVSEDKNSQINGTEAEDSKEKTSAQVQNSLVVGL